MSGTIKIFYMYIIHLEVIQTDFDKFHQTSEEWMPVWATEASIIHVEVYNTLSQSLLIRIYLNIFLN